MNVQTTNDSSKISAYEALPKGYCTGCSACISICPKNALKLSADEFGYYVPEVDLDLCNRCGQCQKICPAINYSRKNSKNRTAPDLLAVKISDKEILRKSTSGGIFSLLATGILKNGGYVCGAAWTEDLNVKHIIVNRIEDLALLRKSKYLQSRIDGIFKQIKDILNDGKKCLFSGCPCQVAGLKSYLRKDYSNLITVDLLCGNAPSASFFQKYLKENFDEKPSSYEFRTKDGGLWHEHASKVICGNKIKIVKKVEDTYQKAYHPHIMCPIHCEQCKYQKLPRCGDITIGDFWGIKKRLPNIEVSDGISAVLLNNDKGQTYFSTISDSEFNLKRIVPLEWLGGNGYALKVTSNYASPGRNRFYKTIKTGMNFSEALNVANRRPVIEQIKAETCNAVSSYKSQERKDFILNTEYWEEHHILGDTYIFVKNSVSTPQKYAQRKFDKRLIKDCWYRIYIKFKLSTTSAIVNFHLMDTDNNKYRIIYKHKVKPEDSENYSEIEIAFLADQFYDSFMVGASQFTGHDPWFAMKAMCVFKDKVVYE